MKLPEVRILSSQVDEDSFRVYHEKESIFNQIRLEENNAAFAKLKEQAEKRRGGKRALWECKK